MTTIKELDERIKNYTGEDDMHGIGRKILKEWRQDLINKQKYFRSLKKYRKDGKTIIEIDKFEDVEFFGDNKKETSHK